MSKIKVRDKDEIKAELPALDASQFNAAVREVEKRRVDREKLSTADVVDHQTDTALAMKDILSKRMKMTADHDELSRQEWFGGLYVQDGVPLMPADNILRALWDAARKTKEGPKVKAGVFVTSDSVISHNGPRTLDKSVRRRPGRCKCLIWYKPCRFAAQHAVG
jgi:hypothetical protein